MCQESRDPDLLDSPQSPGEGLQPEILAYYQDHFDESSRLLKGVERLEYLRTVRLLDQHLPSPPARILDVGGASGAYSVLLRKKGYEVHLVDPVPRHVDLARAALQTVECTLPFSASIGHACSLEAGDDSMDAVLLMGPLYHLQRRGDRLKAIGEAKRVLRSEGLFFATAITRFAALIGGLAGGFVFDPVFAGIVRQDLESGNHVNDSGNPFYFTTSFFHHPRELEAEVSESGLEVAQIVAIEGPGWAVRELDRVLDSENRETLVEFLNAVEDEPTLLGASPHLAVTARKRPSA